MKMPVCTWPGCFSSFVCNSSLKRHVKSVHEKVRSYICSKAKCGAAFRSAYDLKRHKLGVHVEERNYKCSRCTKSFALYDKLHRHEEVVHGTRRRTTCKTIYVEKPSFICAECGVCYSRKDNLVRHISTKHSDYDYLKCHNCGYNCSRKNVLKKHIFKCCKKLHPMPIQKRYLCCFLCKQSYQFVNQVHEHYAKAHDVDLNARTLSFTSIQEFLNWKKRLENRTETRFYLRRKAKNKCVYSCYKSGSYSVQSSDRKRMLLLQDSKKLDGVCPASIILCLNDSDSSCVTTFIQTHLGHLPNDKNDLKFVFLPKEDRKRLTGIFTSAVPKSVMRDDQLKPCNTLLCDFMNADIEINNLTNNTDLCNIERCFKVECKENLVKKHQDDYQSMKAFNNEFKESVLLYKQQNECSPKNFLIST